MIARTRARGPCHLFCSASRARVLYETPAKVLEQCIELFGNLSNNLLSTAFIFARWFFPVVKRNLTGLFFITIPTNVLVVFFFFCSSVSWGQSWRKKTNVNCTSRPLKKTTQKTTRSFVGIVMKNNPAKFRIRTRKNQGAKVWRG